MKNLLLFYRYKIGMGILTLLLVIGIAFPSCDIDDDINCSCPPIEGEYFRITDLNLLNYTTDVQSSNAVLMATNEKSTIDKYFMILEIDPEFYSHKKQNRRWGFSFMNSALACSCIDNGWNGAKEKIAEMTIITKNDFSMEYMANDTLNANIEIFDQYVGENESIDAFVSRGDNLLQHYGFKLFLKNTPTINPEFKIEIIVKLDNGTEFKTENEPVIIE